MDQNFSCVPPPENWLQMGKIKKVFQIAQNGGKDLNNKLPEMKRKLDISFKLIFFDPTPSPLPHSGGRKKTSQELHLTQECHLTGSRSNVKTTSPEEDGHKEVQPHICKQLQSKTMSQEKTSKEEKLNEGRTHINNT